MDFREIIGKVEEFHNAFGVHNNSRPTLQSINVTSLRSKLMVEEVDEYLEAQTIGDVADALGDQLYILCGTIAVHGLQDKIVDVFNAIHESNMSKLGLDGNPVINGKQVFDESKPIGKILKGPNYFTPTSQIEEILKSNGE